MCATDIGSGANRLQVHGPTEKSARGDSPRVERCAPTVLKEPAEATDVVAAQKDAAAAQKDEGVASKEQRRRNDAKPRSSRCHSESVEAEH